MNVLLALLLFLPLGGSLINLLFGRILPRRGVEAAACAAVLGSLLAAGTAFFLGWRGTYDLMLLDWFRVGEFSAAMSLHFDPVAALMALVVTLVAAIIHLYSVAFMREEPDYVRYFCYLNLFVFAMLAITLGNNLLFVFLGWEGVGFCSYALIGFWYADPAKATAGRKAFIVTRIGDVGFGIFVALSFFLFKDVSLTSINAQAPSLSPGLATVLSLLLLWSAMGKSAQLPLTVWLPDAMAGPTPVSALIHAATMVTAGVYLLVRFFPLVSLSPLALMLIATVGALTSLYGAWAALAQRDIKAVLAYSTLSQVGYMFLAVGAADLVGAMFHLISHAFFKALLFLFAGCVIQAMADEHDIFRMGNLKRLLPGVYWLGLIGTLCLSAFPLIGGFFSKDRILLATFIYPHPVYKVFWAMAALGAGLTPLYAFRLLVTVSLPWPEGPQEQDLKPIPRFMVGVLWPLAILALLDGLLNLPVGPGKRWLSHYLSAVPGSRPELGASAALHLDMALGSVLVVLAAIAMAYYLFRPPGARVRWPRIQEWCLTGFYLDWLYLNFLARPYAWMARLWYQADEEGLDRSYVRMARAAFRPYWRLAGILWQRVDEGGVDHAFEKAGSRLLDLSRGLGLWANGRLSTYLAMVFLGLTLLLCALAVSLRP